MNSSSLVGVVISICMCSKNYVYIAFFFFIFSEAHQPLDNSRIDTGSPKEALQAPNLRLETRAVPFCGRSG